jgi:GNAT superfamily N-acetyltransferase
MTYAIQDLVTRNVAPVGTTAISALVAGALDDDPVARWLLPDPADRPRYFAILVEQAVWCGEVYATADASTGRLSGAALWFASVAAMPAPADHERRVPPVAHDEALISLVAPDPERAVVDRACELDAALDARRPLEPHHHLACLAVLPEGRGRGIADALLDRHHSRLDAAGLPAYAETGRPDDRDLYLRHGYQVRSVLELPDGPPIWTMWRLPMA